MWLKTNACLANRRPWVPILLPPSLPHPCQKIKIKKAKEEKKVEWNQEAVGQCAGRLAGLSCLDVGTWRGPS
jgi:hypothetical protein